jgi:hypothetical protein
MVKKWLSKTTEKIQLKKKEKKSTMIRKRENWWGKQNKNQKKIGAVSRKDEGAKRWILQMFVTEKIVLKGITMML